MRQLKKAKWRRAKWGLTATLIVLLGCVGVSLTPTGRSFWKSLSEMADTMTDKAALRLGQATVSGYARTNKQDIVKKINLSQGMPIFDIDLDRVREQVLELPWVKTPVVKRQLPATLLIEITEKEPIALWQNNKKYWPLDTDGQPIRDDKTVLTNLILVVGQDAPKHTPALMKTLESYPELREKVRSAVRVGNRRWNLILNDAEEGLVIKLPEEELDTALRRLMRADDTDKLLKRDLKSIDLRLDDRIIVREKGKSEK